MLVVMVIGGFLGAYLVAAGAVPSQVVLRAGEAVPGVDVPQGFTITTFTTDLAAPRFMTFHDESETLLVSERGAGRVVALPDADQDGVADKVQVVVDKLVAPTGLAYDNGWLYVAEGNQVSRFKLDDALNVQETEVIIPDLPGGKNKNEVDPVSHALLIHERELYVSVGASCAACEQTDSRRATIMVYNLDGSNERVYTRGVYYALGLAVNPVTEQLWASNQGRPEFPNDAPETIYALQNSDDLGWYRCYAGNIPDPEFGGEDACTNVLAPLLALEPQSNIAGIAFYTTEAVPENYRNDLLVVLHGGVNSKEEQVGLEVRRYDIDPATGALLDSKAHEFATGWWKSEEPGDLRGRPLGILLAPDGTLYITDDHTGAVYRVVYTG